VGRPDGFVGWSGFFSPERSEVGRTGTLASLCSDAPVLKFDHTISSALSCFAMPEPIDKLLLARAFDLAWEQFYGSSVNSAPLPEDIARPALAKFLVDMAKSGVREENALAAAGVLHLVALTMERPKR